jgi:hypothetical protein
VDGLSFDSILETEASWLEREFEEVRKVVTACISSMHFSALVNSNPTGFFSSSRSLRQGDPLSPLLFVFVMEALDRMISVVVSGVLLDGFLVGNVVFSHLLLADDILIFCGAFSAHLRLLQSLFLCFEAASGRKVMAKLELVLVGNVDQVESLSKMLIRWKGWRVC